MHNEVTVIVRRRMHTSMNNDMSSKRHVLTTTTAADFVTDDGCRVPSTKEVPEKVVKKKKGINI